MRKLGKRAISTTSSIEAFRCNCISQCNRYCRSCTSCPPGTNDQKHEMDNAHYSSQGVTASISGGLSG
ncbi:MAG: CLI_3235 family bacteriocin precursor [Oscillospiraceae bacterium]|nr:CLI_3235 family bacteriocin precursor [Oscillospiraceae bacterium]